MIVLATTQIPVTRPPARTLGRRALTLLGALIALAMIGFGALDLLDLAASHSFTAGGRYTGVRSLVIESGSGDIHLVGAPEGSSLMVSEHVEEGLSKPHREARRSTTGALRLHASCSLLSQCGVSYDVSVPDGVTVDARSGAGNVTASGLATKQGSLQLRSGAGDVTATRLSAHTVKLSSGAGDITAQLTNPADLLTASSGAGDLRLRVPNVPYAVNASSGAGSVSDHSLRIDPSATHAISASSGAGDVTISAGEVR